MKEMIIGSLEMICKVSVVLILIGAFLGGYQSSGIAMGILAVLVAFLGCSLLFGFLFVLLEINENIRAIRKRLMEIDAPKPKAEA